MALSNTFRILWTHPVTRTHRAEALARWVRWQVGSRLVPGPVVVPFVDDTRLIVRRGMHSATGALYLGLEEFEDMLFVLHLLRPGDHFGDVGGNVGVYSILAAHAGATGVAWEPVPGVCQVLRDNLALNGFEARIEVRNAGVGAEPGTLQFTQALGTVNHVLAEGEAAGPVVTCPVETLDAAIGQPPTLLKIDVEGFETAVLAGGAHTLAHPALMAVVLELNGAGARYGHRDADLDATMRGHGFAPHRYVPAERALVPLATFNTRGNTLYVRDAEAARARLREARRFEVRGTRY